MIKRYVMLPVAILVSATACDRGEPGEVDRGADAVPVTTSTVATVEGRTQVPARIVARQTAYLATRTSGIVEAVAVDVGEPVRAGQVLVRLDAAGVTSAIERADAQASVARRTHERISNLERDGAATRQELDQADAALRGAEAVLGEALAAREYVTMRAPFDGTVTERHVDPGSLAVPGRPVLSIAGAHGVKIEADLPADLAAKVATGDEIDVFRADTGERWSAVVTRVVPVIELASQRFRVEAAFGGSVSPPPGTFARLELVTGGEASSWAPADALVRRGQLTGVFVVSEGELRIRWIRTGRQVGEAVEVLSGLAAGASVVRRPGPGMLDGNPVAEVSEEAWSFVPEGGR